MAKRRNPTPAVLVTADDEEVASGNPLPVGPIGAGDSVIGRVKITDGSDVALVDASGNLMVNVAAGGAGDGAILDGVSSSIKATVLDYVSSNPLAVRLTDTGGDYVAAGAGTQYTEDAAAAADPVGSVPMLVRRDTPSATEVSAENDNVAAKGSSAGAQYVELLSGIAKIPGDAANGLDVDVTRSALPSGAATSAKQDSLLAELQLKADLTETQPVSLATVPSHAVTNAGTFVVQENGAALTALQLIDNLVLAEDAAHVTADPGVQALAVRKATPANLSGTDGDYEPLQMSAGRLWVDPSGVTLTVGSHAVTNAGTFAVQVDGAALTSLQLIDDAIVADDAAFTPATTKVMMAGFEADEAAIDSVNEGDGGAARMTLDRKVIVSPHPHTAGGLTIFRSIDIDETEEEVKATAGQLYSIAAFNRTAAPLYLKFYDATAATVVVGTTTPVLTFVVPANADSDGAGFILEKAYGWVFATAITVACTTGIADADTGAPGANDCVINLGYT